MSIAINTQRAHAPARRLVRTTPVVRSAASTEEQLRGSRALMRHFMLAFFAAGAAVYAAVAAGLTI